MGKGGRAHHLRPVDSQTREIGLGSYFPILARVKGVSCLGGPGLQLEAPEKGAGRG